MATARSLAFLAFLCIASSPRADSVGGGSSSGGSSSSRRTHLSICSYATMEALEGIYGAMAGSGWLCGSPGRVCDQSVWVIKDKGEGGVFKEAAAGGSKKGLAWSVGLGTPWRDGSGGVRMSVTHCCEWYGVACLPDGSVGALTLSDNTLEGTIPRAFFSLLPSLQHLDLSSNALTGHIPPDLATHPSLRVVLLHKNALNGTIPESLAQSSVMERLVLSSNRLTGNIPSALGSMPRLEYLLLNDNFITGTIPRELGNAPNLTHLFLYNNLLHGTVPSELHLEGAGRRLPHYIYVNGNNQPHRLGSHHSADPSHAEPRHKSVAKGKLEADIKDWREDIKSETPEEASRRRQKMQREYNRLQMQAFKNIKRDEGDEGVTSWWVGDEL